MENNFRSSDEETNSELASHMAENILQGDDDTDSKIREEHQKLRDFHITDVLQIIEETINSEEYDIGALIIKISNSCKGTKAEPFLVKLKEYFESKYAPDQTIYKIMKKFGEIKKGMQPFNPPPFAPAPNFSQHLAGPMQDHFHAPHPEHPHIEDVEMHSDHVAEFHDFLRGRGHHLGRGGFRGRGRGRGFHRGGHFMHDNRQHSNSDSNSNSSSDEEGKDENKSRKRHRNNDHKRRNRDPEFLREQNLKKCIVVSEHNGFLAGLSNTLVEVELIVENQSFKNVPKHTFIMKADEDSPLSIEPLQTHSIRKNTSRALKLNIKLPKEPGEYK